MILVDVFITVGALGTISQNVVKIASLTHCPTKSPAESTLETDPFKTGYLSMSVNVLWSPSGYPFQVIQTWCLFVDTIWSGKNYFSIKKPSTLSSWDSPRPVLEYGLELECLHQFLEILRHFVFPGIVDGIYAIVAHNYYFKTIFSIVFRIFKCSY